MASNIEINYHKNTHTNNNNNKKILKLIIIVHIMIVKILKTALNNK